MNLQDQLTKIMKTGLSLLSLVLLGCICFYGGSQTLSVFQDTNNRELPIYCVDTDKSYVSLSFDAAWGNEDTQILLDIFKKYNIKVTFFMTGGWVDQYPEDVKKIAKAGHDLANHSQSHKQMSQLSATECEEEIRVVNEKIKELTGKTPILFRPPYGDYNNTLIQAVRNCNCHCIQWDVDILDIKVKIM